MRILGIPTLLLILALSLAAQSRPVAPTLYVFIGESNSGGYALNSEAEPRELIPRPLVRILNNNTLQFEPLQIGVNNLIGHTGLAKGTHGWEAQLADKAEQDGQLVYLIKAGQGGSTAAEWQGEYFRIFQERLQAARLEARSSRAVVFLSLGINDAIRGTDPAQFRADMMALVANLRRELGADTPIAITRFEDMGYTAINNMLSKVCDRVPNVRCIDTSGASRRDKNHWNHAGIKNVAARMFISPR